MLHCLPNEVICNIIQFCDELTVKQVKLTSKFGYIISKDFELRKLIKLNKQRPNVIYKLCIKHYLYPYSVSDINKISKIDKLFLELKLRFFITNTSINSMTKSFEIFYNALKRFNKI